jgi:DNA-binding beta-propeller fold protein YncE
VLDPPLVWPGPPEKARIRYVGALSTEADLKKEVSWTQGFEELIFGKKEIGVLIGPYSVAIDGDDRLFVADSGSGFVNVFDLSRREYKQFSSLERGETLLKPVALTIIGGRIYVVDSVLRRVCVFEKGGRFVYYFGPEQLKRPAGIAHSQAGDVVYVSDAGNHVVNVFGTDGELLDTIGSRGFAPGHFNFPTHLWVDKEDRLYVADTLNYRIQVFGKDGKFLRMFGQQGDRPGYFAHPTGVATDSFGHIYVTDRQFENIQIFDEQGGILLALGQEGGGPGQFWLPAGIYIDDRDRIYVADSFNKRVQIFELLGGSDK